MSSKPLLTLVIIWAFIADGLANTADWHSIKTEFNTEFSPFPDLNKPGYVVSISNPDGIQMHVQSGAADIEQGRLINMNTVFHIASLSKQITAAVLAHAILDNKVSLDDKVSRWLPDTTKYGDKLRIKHLLYMTSGLTEYTNVARPGLKPWSTFHYFSVKEAIQSSLSVQKLQFQPGTQWQYSNINYMLITEIIAKAYQKPFSLIVEEKIFTPLKMNSSSINDDITQIIPNRANAYFERSESVTNELNTGAQVYARKQNGYAMVRRNAPHYGGSGVMTSMNDWAKWQREMLTHNTWGNTFWKTMFSTIKFDHEKDNDAFGLVHGVYVGKPTLWYEGGDIDSSSYSITLPTLEINISCFSNNPLDICRKKVMFLLKILSKDNWVQIDQAGLY